MKSECKRVRLGDVCELVAGFAFKSTHFGSYDDKVIKIANIEPPRVNMQNLSGVDISKYSRDKLSKFIVKDGDFVFAMTGATIGKIGRIENGQAYINQRVLTFRPNNVDKDFLYYALMSYTFQQYVINHIDSESAQPNISAGTVGKYEFDLPSAEKQKQIGKFLRLLDKKIELNNAINKNLEEQAQAIYADMFADKMPFVWTAGQLSDIADITMGQSPNGDSYNETGEGTVFYQGRAEFGSRFPTRRLFTTEPKRMAQANDTLMSVRAPVGDLNVAYESCCIGRGLAAIHSKYEQQSFVLYTMFALRQQLEVFNGEGTIFRSINRDALNSMSIKIPSNELITRFEQLVNPMDAVIRNNYEENCRLIAVRDTLLPKLMSGEIDVSNVSI